MTRDRTQATTVRAQNFITEPAGQEYERVAVYDSPALAEAQVYMLLVR